RTGTPIGPPLGITLYGYPSGAGATSFGSGSGSASASASGSAPLGGSIAQHPDTLTSKPETLLNEGYDLEAQPNSLDRRLDGPESGSGSTSQGDSNTSNGSASSSSSGSTSLGDDAPLTEVDLVEQVLDLLSGQLQVLD